MVKSMTIDKDYQMYIQLALQQSHQPTKGHIMNSNVDLTVEFFSSVHV